MALEGGSNTRISPGVVLPDAALRWSFSRSGGPGGQNVNKVNSQATLTVHLADLAPVMPQGAIHRLKDQAGQRLASDPDRVQVSSSASRSQRANRKACLLKLREMVVRAMHRPRPRKRTRPSRGAIQRRLDRKKQRGRLKSQRGRNWREADA